MTHPCRNQYGFSLIELMVVVAIIAILATIAFPSYQEAVKESRRGDAQAALMAFSAAMERYFTMNNTYLNAAAGGADTGKPDPNLYPGNNQYYNFTIQAATGTTYTLRASPINTQAQAGDGYLELTSTGVKRWNEDNNGAIVASERDWEEG